MRALSIRQPYAEEILQGIKTIEYRPNPTKKIGERFFIYAAMQYPKPADLKKFCKRYRTMKLIKEAEAAGEVGGVGGLPRGVIVGIATISHVTPPTKKMPYFHWHLTDVERLELPMKPHRMPQAQWFAPSPVQPADHPRRKVPKGKGNGGRPATMKLKLVRD